MSIRSGIGRQEPGVTFPRTFFPCEAIPYLASSADALIILLASLVGAIGYHIGSEPRS